MWLGSIPFLLVITVVPVAPNGDKFELTILHTTDVHSRIEPFNNDGNACTKDDIKARKCWGGVSRRMTAVKRIKEDVEKKQGQLLLLDAGDQFQGTGWYRNFEGTIIAKYMQLMGYDAMALGKHEFDDGVEVLAKFLTLMKQANVPVLSSNIVDNGTPLKQFIQKETIVQKGQEKIGIIGCTTTDTAEDPDPSPQLIFLPEVEAVGDVVQNMIADHKINKVIVVSHAGIKVDRELCKVAGVDMVIGGNSHRFLHNGEPAAYPEVYDNNGHPCLVATADQFGKSLGRLDVTFDKEGILQNADQLHKHNNPILLDSSYPDDKDMNNMLKPYKAQLDKTQKATLAKTTVKLDGTRLTCRNMECNVGNILTDAIVHHYPGVIALWNGGSMREFQAPAGTTLTLAHLYQIMQFKYYIYKYSISGKNLREAFKHSVQGIDKTWPKGPYLQVSGIKVEYDVSKTEEKGVHSLKVPSKSNPANWEEVKDDQEYEVGTIGFLAKGYDGYDETLKVPKEKLIQLEKAKVLDLTLITKYLKDSKTIKTERDGRIRYYCGPNKIQDEPKCKL